MGLEYLKCLCLLAGQQAWGWVTSIILESFCIKELEQLGFSLDYDDQSEGNGVLIVHVKKNAPLIKDTDTTRINKKAALSNDDLSNQLFKSS